MRRVSQAVAVAAVVFALTGSSLQAAPRSRTSEPSLVSRIVKLIRNVVALDDLSWPKP